MINDHIEILIMLAEDHSSEALLVTMPTSMLSLILDFVHYKLQLSSTFCNIGCRDVTYVTSSGSIIAASGYSSIGVNVIIWDTLAPPSTSRASIMCHEGFLFSFNYFTAMRSLHCLLPAPLPQLQLFSSMACIFNVKSSCIFSRT